MMCAQLTKELPVPNDTWPVQTCAPGASAAGPEEAPGNPCSSGGGTASAGAEVRLSGRQHMHAPFHCT